MVFPAIIEKHLFSMEPLAYYVDLHCHTTLKPFAKSFHRQFQNSNNPRHRHSVWYYCRPALFQKILNGVSSLTKFNQGSFSHLHKGNTRVVCTALYPFERDFVANRLGDGPLARMIAQVAAGLTRHMTRAVVSWRNYDYFEALEQELAYLEQLHDCEVRTPDGSLARYRIVSDFEELRKVLESPDGNTIAVITSIEGAHAFGTGLLRDAGIGQAAFERQVLDHVQRVKNWRFKPLFVSMAHHFYNELCGHAPSIDGFATRILHQHEGMQEGFTDLGSKVLHTLLDDRDGRRILIDIKHMSKAAREEYYAVLDREYAHEDIPLIVSHGAVTGYPSRPGRFLNEEINFDDAELIRIGRSGGILGLQLDERRIGSRDMLRKTRGKTRRHAVLHRWARLVWYQVQHVAEVLDRAGLFAWGNVCLGTDYDGIINPISGYWTAEDLTSLERYLLQHARVYMDDSLTGHTGHKAVTLPINQISPEEIVARVMQQNAMHFFERHLRCGHVQSARCGGDVSRYVV